MPESKTTSDHSGEKCQEIISSLTDYAIITTDKSLIITGWYAGAEKLLGYKEEEIIGKSLKIFFTEADIKNDIHIKEAEIALKEGRLIDERWHIKKDNQRFFGFGLIFPLKNKKGEWIGYTKIFRNLTQRKEADDSLNDSYKQLEELNFHKEKIVSVLSHDLRSPLNSILSTTQILLNNLDKIDRDDTLKMVQILQKSAQKVLNQLEDLTNWAKVKLSKDIFNPEKIKLCSLMSSSYGILKEYATGKGIEFLNRVGEDVFVKADKKMLFSVFQNLISNSMKFTEIGGKITADAITEGDKVTVRISDTGVGMPKDTVEKLFKTKPVSSERGTNKEIGSGIGLMLVMEFIKKNGGDIWIESEEGVGTSVIFTLEKA
jgi:PAS domain S-box-containing protein